MKPTAGDRRDGSGRVRSPGAGLTPLSAIRPGPLLATGAAELIAARSAWWQAAGPEMAARLPLVGREADALIIGVPDGGWERQLKSLEPELCRRLAHVPGMEGVRRIVSRPCLRPDRAAPAQSTPPPPDREGTARSRLERLARRLLGEGPG